MIEQEKEKKRSRWSGRSDVILYIISPHSIVLDQFKNVKQILHVSTLRRFKKNSVKSEYKNDL